MTAAVPEAAEKDVVGHLQMIETNITRMNHCSFQLKGWCVTVVSAFLALYASSVKELEGGKVFYLFAAVLPTLLFWLLDSYYLQQERKFCGLYNDVARKLVPGGAAENPVPPYQMPLGRYTGGRYRLIRAMFSLSEWVLYLPIAGVLVTAGVLLCG